MDEVENNPASYLAEIQVLQVEASKKDSLNVGQLDYSCQQLLEQALHDYADICAINQTEIGRTTLIKYRILIENATPIAQKPYQMNPENETFLNEEVK